MDGEELARATAAALGGEVEAATKEVLEGGRPRAFGVTEAVNIGTFSVSIAQVAVTWYQASTSRKELIAGLLKDELASGRLSQEKREEIVSRMADQLLGAPKSDAVLRGKRDFLRDWAKSSDFEDPESSERDFRPADPSATTRRFGAAPGLIPFADQDYWYLAKPLVWQSDHTSPKKVEVPKGFVTDFASVPSMFWTWLPRIGRYGLPAIAHDWLYWDQSAADRDDADRLLNTAMADFDVSGMRRTLIYRAVQLFGGFAWDGNKKQKDNGAKRVLKKFPPTANISWEEWRSDPNVFV
jgi:hypothetical protein